MDQGKEKEFSWGQILFLSCPGKWMFRSRFIPKCDARIFPWVSWGRRNRDGFCLHMLCRTCLDYTGKQAAGSCNHIPLTKKVKSTSDTMILPVFLPWPQQFVLHKTEMLQSHTEVIRFNLAQHPSERKKNHRRSQHILKVLPFPFKS